MLSQLSLVVPPSTDRSSMICLLWCYYIGFASKHPNWLWLHLKLNSTDWHPIYPWPKSRSIEMLIFSATIFFAWKLAVLLEVYCCCPPLSVHLFIYALPSNIPPTGRVKSQLTMLMEVEQNKVVCQIASRFLCAVFVLSLSDRPLSIPIPPLKLTVLLWLIAMLKCLLSFTTTQSIRGFVCRESQWKQLL